MLEILTYLSAILLIPLIPALLIYKLLPSRTSVSGPFKGLSIQLQGAFGGFFLLVLISIGLVTYFTNMNSTTVYHGFYLVFPVEAVDEDVPDGVGNEKIYVLKKSGGKGEWTSHEKYNPDIGQSVKYVEVTDIANNDTISIVIKNDDKYWMSSVRAIPKNHISMRLLSDAEKQFLGNSIE